VGRDTNAAAATSNGLRLAYWRVSIKSISEAPFFGHGTGSTQQIFSREAEGKSGEWGNIIRNPHNQTLYVAIQWGLLGCLILYAMWYFHLRLFLGSGFASWIGLVIVVQNFISSLLNSHLFDFHEGWVYVLGVGVAGGMVARAQRLSGAVQAWNKQA
jgi:O-antigen ligase